MDATGVKFTWSNGRQGCDNVRKMLNRFLANADWCRLSSPQDCDFIIDCFDQSLTENDTLSLKKHVTMEEVYDALMQMALTKAPGPDGHALILGEGQALILKEGPKVDKGRRRRLHPLGGYIITLYTNGKLRTKVTIMLVSGADGHTSKGVGLPMTDSHTGNRREDDFTALETFEGCNGGCKLLRRLQAAKKVAKEVAGCYEGFHIGCKLLQKLHADVEAKTLLRKLQCCKEGCNKGFRLLRRLPHRFWWLLRRLSYMLQAAVKAATKVGG
nr:reverse transcriptase [Tanacetum cinerariifolium]